MDKDESYKKAERITKKRQYQEVFQNGVKYNGLFMKIHCVYGGEKRRIGIIISRMIKGSVIRNRYKRLLREAYRLNKDKIPGDMSIVVVVYKKINKSHLGNVTQSLMDLVGKAVKNEKNIH